MVDASEEGSVARVLADRVKKRVHAHESHVEAVLVKRMVEGVECVVEFVDPKIVNTDLVSSAGFRGEGEENLAARLPIRLPSVLLIHRKKCARIDL